jgi:hypothetical protein
MKLRMSERHGFRCKVVKLSIHFIGENLETVFNHTFYFNVGKIGMEMNNEIL